MSEEERAEKEDSRRDLDLDWKWEPLGLKAFMGANLEDQGRAYARLIWEYQETVNSLHQVCGEHFAYRCRVHTLDSEVAANAAKALPKSGACASRGSCRVGPSFLTRTM